MERNGRDAAENVAQGLSAGVRTAMLSGNGITARTMVRDARERLSTAEVRIYAPNGEEVFGAHAPAPGQLRTCPRTFATVLGDAKPHPPDDSTEALPIENEKRCQKCHDDGATSRRAHPRHRGRQRGTEVAATRPSTCSTASPNPRSSRS